MWNEIALVWQIWWNAGMYEPPKQRWGCLQWGTVLVVGLLSWMLIASYQPMISKQGLQMRGVANCQNVILSLHHWSYDNGLGYPDSWAARDGVVSANQVFRILFQDGVVTDESIFGCPNSVFVPDGKIEMKPEFAQALTPGECHWMLLKFQTGAAVSDTPLLIENALNASWPPKWDVSVQAGNKRGRAWKGRQIIVGRNDGSVALEKLSPDGTIDWHSRGNLGPDGKRWIDTLTPEQVAKLSYWDIEEK